MTGTCPICGSAAQADASDSSRPFCSSRCKKIDLSNWLSEKYNLPRPLSAEDFDALSPGEQGQLLHELTERDPDGQISH